MEHRLNTDWKDRATSVRVGNSPVHACTITSLICVSSVFHLWLISSLCLCASVVRNALQAHRECDCYNLNGTTLRCRFPTREGITPMKWIVRSILLALILGVPAFAAAQQPEPIARRFTRTESMLVMRAGGNLY